MKHQHAAHGQHSAQGKGHYLKLAAMIGLSFIAMYALMYAMVDRFANVYNNVNQFYMAGLMVAPMLVIELALMWHMYPDRKLNAVLLTVGLIAGIAFWFLIRQQTAVTERQFLRSMIPHHAGAILMCEEAPVRDAEVRALCSRITASQEREIAQMKALLAR